MLAVLLLVATKIQELFQLQFCKFRLSVLFSLYRAQLLRFPLNFLRFPRIRFGVGTYADLYTTIYLFLGPLIDSQFLKDKILPSVNTWNLHIVLVYKEAGNIH